MFHNFVELPPEVLGQIALHFDAPKDLYHLSLTCRRLYDYVQLDGYRIFVQTNFNFNTLPCFARQAAHSLTTQARCWQRRSFQATYVLPEFDSTPLQQISSDIPHQNPPSWPRRQSMGYQAQIDCVEEREGSTWNSRKEIVAVGAGAELIIRIRTTGKQVEQSYFAASEKDRDYRYDLLRHRRRELVWKEDFYKEGRDDIVSVNILRDQDRAVEDRDFLHDIIVGRASGILEKASISHNTVKTTRYETNARPVRCADLSPSGSLLAACFANRDIALYNTQPTSQTSQPVSEIVLKTSKENSRIWTSRFLGPSRIALGHGFSTSPLSVYEMTPSGIYPEPIQTFTSETTSSVYAITTIPSSTHLFLSGWYNGEIRLHDHRTPETISSSAVATFLDPLDSTSPIYSLLPHGSDRFIAGGARHALVKVFDLRMPGRRQYSSLSSATNDGHGRGDSFNLFIRHRSHPPNPMASYYNKPLQRPSPPEQLSSPIYSLASASPFSSTFYAGLENAIVQFRLADPDDPWPEHEYERLGEVRRSLRKWWTKGDYQSKDRVKISKEAFGIAGVALGLAEYGERGGNQAGIDSVEGAASGRVKLYSLDEADDAIGAALNESDIKIGDIDSGSSHTYPATSHGWLDPRWRNENEPRQPRGLMRRGEGRTRGTDWGGQGGRRGNRAAMNLPHR